jgi:hypothetical protein
MSTPAPPDPFGEKRPSLSFKNAPIGTTYVGTIIEEPRTVQSRDFKTKEPKFYRDGNPMWSVVVGLLVDGEERSLWCNWPSSMQRALGEAHRKYKGLKLGGKLAVRLVGENPQDDPSLSPEKLYEVFYQPPMESQSQPGQPPSPFDSESKSAADPWEPPKPAADPWELPKPAADPWAPAYGPTQEGPPF